MAGGTVSLRRTKYHPIPVHDYIKAQAIETQKAERQVPSLVS